MLSILKWAFMISFWGTFLAFLHYTLPQRDIVYVQGTEIIRQDFSGFNRLFYAQADSGNTDPTLNRDLRLINATRANGRVTVYRNEDTGFGWPPYFKLDSSNLQAEAQQSVSSKANPDWYLLTHYGWRNELLTIYPNAISLKPIAGPDVGKPIPWVNIVILSLLGILIAGLWVRWRRFRAKRIDPTLEEWQDGLESAGDAMASRGSRIKKWFASWRSG